jgi:hypothetical protein
MYDDRNEPLIDDEDQAYDRLEALGEAREAEGNPQVWDDEYWEGVL